MASFKVCDNCPDGAQISDASSSKLGFFGATPVGQQTAATNPTVYADSTQVATAVIAINTALKNLGLLV